MEDTQTIVKKTFKDVHQDIDNEFIFLKQHHDVKDFKTKGDFLSQVGFKNSIATRLYRAISDNPFRAQEYERKYFGQYKFLLKPQLERLCEKYDLYVRNPDMFLGDIPEKNVKDIMDFKVDIYDLPNFNGLSYDEKCNIIERLKKEIDIFFLKSFDNNIKLDVPINLIPRLNKILNLNTIQIAAVKKLFDEKAFESSDARILGMAELEPLHKVELDPIVLCEVNGGYIVITAWGDEANDELLFDQKQN